MASGMPTSGSTAPPRGATRPAIGGATTTPTASADRRRRPSIHTNRNAIMRNHVVSKRGQDAPHAAARSAAGWLYLAAAPTFAAMALLTGLGGGPLDALCTDASPLHGMALMYGLMSA